MILYTLLDERYFHHYGQPLLASAVKHGVRIHIDLAGVLSKQTLDECDALRESGVTYDRIMPNGGTNAEYAVTRFLRLPDMLDRFGDCLVINGSSVVRRPFTIDDLNPDGMDVLYARPKDHVLGTVVFFSASRTGPVTARLVSEDLKGFNPPKWFDDQDTLTSILPNSPRSGILPPVYRDFEFVRNDARIWTAKGGKKNRLRFVHEQNKYRDAPVLPADLGERRVIHERAREWKP